MKLWTAAAGGLGIILAGIGLFFLFRWYLTRLVDRRIEGFQNDLISRQVDEVENMYRQMRGGGMTLRIIPRPCWFSYRMGRRSSLEGYLQNLNEDLTAWIRY